MKKRETVAIAGLRKEYTRANLTETDLDHNPFKQFIKWFNDAVAQKLLEPNAMVVATASLKGKPSARIVLMKEFDERGFVFYTNYESRKGQELAQNSHVALVFYWAELERQVRITGVASKVAAEESAAYFHSRPPQAQLAAWTSRQSRVIGGREVLDDSLKEVVKRFRGKKAPLPPYWGGYRVLPNEFEFWQGRPSRLHDRLCYTQERDGTWLITRLSP
jgi:pyridoxamine 5'-phosphate oxidase